MHGTVPRVFDDASLRENELVACWEKSPSQPFEKPRERASRAPFLWCCFGLTAELSKRVEQLVPALVVLRRCRLPLAWWFTRLMMLRWLDSSVGCLRPSL